MDDDFFIAEPEKLENNFFNKSKDNNEFEKEFKQKSKEMVQILSQKHRHAKKLSKKTKKASSQPTSAKKK